ncbi:hypothetical protein ACFLSS_01445 [Bacteroidota bacterium]
MKQLLFTLIISFLFSTQIIAQRGVLTGLKSFEVIVSLSEQLEAHSYNSDTIKTDVELQLKLSGIKVSNDFIKNISGQLFVDVITYDFYENYFAYTISLLVIEAVFVPRLNIDDYGAITWHTNSVGVSTFDYQGWQFIREIINEKVDNFLNDYLEDNPK